MSSTQPKFFGLTALGAPCPYNPNLLSTVTISIFEEEDVEDAFRATSLSSASGEEFLKDFMAALYGGDFPELEFQRLKGLVEETCDIRTSIPTLKQIKTSVEALQVEGERRQAASEYGVGSGSEHESNQIWREHRFRHLRLKRGPAEKYSVPIIESQKIGWTAPKELRDCVAHEAHPKKSCAETVFQDALVKSGLAPR